MKGLNTYVHEVIAWMRDIVTTKFNIFVFHEDVPEGIAKSMVFALNFKGQTSRI